MEKACRDCGKMKPIDEFHKDKARKDGRSIRCKPCLMLLQAEYKKRPPRHQTPAGTKRCTLCKATKPEIEFPRDKSFHDGLSRACKACGNARSSAYHADPTKRPHLRKEAMKRYYANEERYAGYGLKKRFGITIDDYNRMLAEQHSKCAICGTGDPGSRLGRFHVDHCHATARIRGLLCGSCNQGIGRFKDDPSLLLAGAAYLRKYNP